jgi:hypothetical protein
MPKSIRIAALQSGLNFKLVENKPLIALITSGFGAVSIRKAGETMGVSSSHTFVVLISTMLQEEKVTWLCIGV